VGRILNIYNKSEDEVLRILISKLPRMGRFSCQYIKRDGSICGKGCMSELGCARHFKARPKKICPICNERTYSKTGICSTHGGIYDHAWRESKKTETESMVTLVTSYDVIKILS
jgi:hypothetical protein